MPRARAVVALDTDVLRRLDQLTRDVQHANRSQAIETKVAAPLSKLARRQLIEECHKLDPVEERALAADGAVDSSLWPPY